MGCEVGQVLLLRAIVARRVQGAMNSGEGLEVGMGDAC